MNRTMQKPVGIREIASIHISKGTQNILNCFAAVLELSNDRLHKDSTKDLAKVNFLWSA